MRRVLFWTVLALGVAGQPVVCVAREPLPPVALELVAEGFNAPVFLVAPPELYGRLVVGDFSTVLEKPSGQLFVATPPASWGAMWSMERLIEMDVRLHSLGEDIDGELYLLTTALGIAVGNSGKVWKLVRAR